MAAAIRATSYASILNEDRDVVLTSAKAPDMTLLSTGCACRKTWQ